MRSAAFTLADACMFVSAATALLGPRSAAPDRAEPHGAGQARRAEQRQLHPVFRAPAPIVLSLSLSLSLMRCCCDQVNVAAEILSRTAPYPVFEASHLALWVRAIRCLCFRLSASLSRWSAGAAHQEPAAPGRDAARPVQCALPALSHPLPRKQPLTSAAGLQNLPVAPNWADHLAELPQGPPKVCCFCVELSVTTPECAGCDV